MKIEDLKIGHKYYVEYLDGGESENYSGPATFVGKSGYNFPQDSLEFYISEDPYERHFDIEDVKYHIRVEEFRLVMEDFDKEIDRMKERYLYMTWDAHREKDYLRGAIYNDLSNKLEMVRRVVWNFVNNDGKLDNDCL